MSGWELAVAVVTGLLVNEWSDASPWLARRIVQWSARRRYGRGQRAEIRSEELSAFIDDRPGKLLKLFTAMGFAMTAILVKSGTQSTPWVQRLLDLLAGIRIPRRRSRLGELQLLIRRLDVGDGQLPDVLLLGTRELFDCRHTTFWLPEGGRYPEVLLTATRDLDGLSDGPKPDVLAKLRQQAYMSGEAIEMYRSHPARSEIAPGWDGEAAIIVALRVSSVVLGTLEITGPSKRRRRFSRRDVAMLETIASHASIAVENGRLMDRLRFDAYHDFLTSLPNRRRILSDLEEGLKVLEGDQTILVVAADVADLRQINSQLGYHTGDLVLQEIGNRLRTMVPAQALVGRVEGSGFAATIRLSQKDTGQPVIEAIRSAFKDPMLLDTISIQLRAGIGYAKATRADKNVELPLQRALDAAYRDKQEITNVPFRL
ncbi:hypothetical protein Rhe02_73260 [Rhizocola hellebori]|uniref:GGDEF domain-containing protein n=1 Tax=Rhizocola hellebori TaxID=1392758 RepID=A0A8J3QGK0_9ACTN|nr:sensor domain-containing diguanylate cyclase [Rhizocola hellebori]GIH09259.1 hypothetical protein Rhe02_73260 [Rhizocola hellebori]